MMPLILGPDQQRRLENLRAFAAGIQSRAYRPGPYSQRETLLHAFDEMVLAVNANPERSHS
jgi:hypothetical protein